MLHVRHKATRSGIGSRAGALVLGVLPLAGLLAGCGGGGGGGSASDPETGDLIVVAVTPTNGQETLPDLSDPELENRLTVKFTATPRAASMIDPTNAFNGLTPNVQILAVDGINPPFYRVAGTPSIDPATQAFTFSPPKNSVTGLVDMTHAQYTVTIGKFVTSALGKELNHGLEDFSASWTVGTDEFAPVVRNTLPAANQQDVPLYSPVVITFNESLDLGSVIFNPGGNSTVIVLDGGTNPPTPLNGTVSLKRNGFDLVFTPDPCVGMPQSTTVVVRLLGSGNTAFLKDKVGNALVGPVVVNAPVPVGGTPITEYQLQFQTKGVKPSPNPAIVWGPGTPKTGLTGYDAYVSTGDTTFAFDMSAVVGEFVLNGRTDVSLVQQILQNNRVPINLFTVPPGWSYGAPYGGDWEAKVGQAGESVLDWRLDSTFLQTYIYQADLANDRIAIINTGTAKVEGHFNGVGTPKGVGISGPGQTSLAPVLYVSNYGEGTLTGIPLGTINVGQPICTAVAELNDDLSRRVFMQAGKNPSGVALEYLGTAIGAVVNQADSELQVFNPTTLQPINNKNGLGLLTQRYQVGENPIDVGWTPITNVGIFAYTANQGGPLHPNGSVSLWWNAGGFTIFAPQSGQVVMTLEEGINVPGRLMPNPIALSCYVPNTNSDDIARCDISIVGASLGTAISLQVGASREVGPNPTSMTWQGPTGLPIAFATLAGSGQVAVWDRNSIIGPPVLYNLPGCRNSFTDWNQ